MVELDKRSPQLPVFIAGAVFGALAVLATQRLFVQPMEVNVPTKPAHQIIESYKTGIEDALQTNPPSWRLEEACLAVWANKQPTQ